MTRTIGDMCAHKAAALEALRARLRGSKFGIGRIARLRGNSRITPARGGPHLAVNDPVPVAGPMPRGNNRRCGLAAVRWRGDGTDKCSTQFGRTWSTLERFRFSETKSFPRPTQVEEAPPGHDARKSGTPHLGRDAAMFCRYPCKRQACCGPNHGLNSATCAFPGADPPAAPAPPA